jgi:hypothetical protein
LETIELENAAEQVVAVAPCGQCSSACGKASTDYITRHAMKRAPHPPDSPDLAPSDFFLFGCVGRKLMGYRAKSESELLVRIGVILAEIPRDVLNAVFFEWMDQLQNACRPMETTPGELKKHES